MSPHTPVTLSEYMNNRLGLQADAGLDLIVARTVQTGNIEEDEHFEDISNRPLPRPKRFDVPRLPSRSFKERWGIAVLSH